MEKYKHKINLSYGNDDIYKSYKDNGGTLTKKQFISIISKFNLKMSNKIVTEGVEFRLPYRLGFIRIKTNKQKIVIKDGKLDKSKLPIDWATTRRIWREDNPDLSWDEIYELEDKPLIYHTNSHANGYIMKWYWDRRLCNIKNQGLYGFKTVKGGDRDGMLYGRRGLASCIKGDDFGNKINYFE